MMLRRRRKKKHWRSNSEYTFPANIEATHYKSLIEKIVSIARGDTIYPKDILNRFQQGFKKRIGQVVKQEEIGLLIRIYRDQISLLDSEDLSQQCYLFLIELWNFYKTKWKNKSKVFYDYARTYLARWMGYYVSTVINKHLAQGKTEHIDQVAFIQDTEEFIKLDLGWVFLRTDEGKFKVLNTKQKYLLYLRFNKEMTIKEISNLINQNFKNVEKEFSVINKLLGE